MALRDMASTAARMSAGFWTEVAKAITPTAQPHASDPTPSATDAPSVTHSGTAGTDTSPGESGESGDGVLVPLDTWTRVLDQLGNLHEAGQQLAEARERAARAEAQVEFLREQLAEAKARATRASSTSARAAGSGSARSGPRVIDLRTTRRARVASARNRVGRWISAT